MKITEINQICDLIGDVDTSILCYAELWDDFERDYPAINKLLEGQPEEVMTMVIPVVSAYVSGWMRARGHKS